MLDALPGIGQYIYCSSAGVYLKSDQMPHCEQDAVDPKSRHKGKLDTEALLAASGVNYTSVRPVYIYGAPPACCSGLWSQCADCPLRRSRAFFQAR